jgi:hypothetical protein
MRSIIWMFRKPVLLSLTFLTAVIWLIQAWPYDNNDVRAFLRPSEGCSLACFMGISLGKTSLDDAVQVLEGSTWVTSVNRRTLRDSTDYVEWKWSGLQPPFIESESRGYLQGNFNHVAARINIRTTLTPADLWWLYGEPVVESGCLEYCRSLHFNFAYPEKGLALSVSTQNCVRPLRALTDAQSTLRFYAMDDLVAGTNNFQNFAIHSIQEFGRRQHCH